MLKRITRRVKRKPTNAGVRQAIAAPGLALKGASPHNDDPMSKPRILGGACRGRPLDTPRRGTRPSPSRLREALFDILAFREAQTFLDLFSGSGAVGLEAASRGWQATCVDLSREAVAVIERNSRALRLDVEVVRGDALKYVRQRDGFEVVFAAPPYPLDLTAIFAAILAARPVSSGGLYIFQHPTKLTLPFGGRVKRYGSNALTLLDADSTPEAGGETAANSVPAQAHRVAAADDEAN